MSKMLNFFLFFLFLLSLIYINIFKDLYNIYYNDKDYFLYNNEIILKPLLKFQCNNTFSFYKNYNNNNFNEKNKIISYLSDFTFYFFNNNNIILFKKVFSSNNEKILFLNWFEKTNKSNILIYLKLMKFFSLYAFSFLIFFLLVFLPIILLSYLLSLIQKILIIFFIFTILFIINSNYNINIVNIFLENLLNIYYNINIINNKI